MEYVGDTPSFRLFTTTHAVLVGTCNDSASNDSVHHVLLADATTMTSSLLILKYEASILLEVTTYCVPNSCNVDRVSAVWQRY